VTRAYTQVHTRLRYIRYTSVFHWYAFRPPRLASQLICVPILIAIEPASWTEKGKGRPTRAHTREVLIHATHATCAAHASRRARAHTHTQVLMMTIPGLALFYGGMVRVTNVLSTLMQVSSV
jgi:hypothetical protein